MQHPSDPVVGITAAMVAAYRNRRWLVAVDMLQAATGIVARLQAWGATDCLVVAGREGTGAPPECPYAILGLPPMPMMEGILSAEEALRSLPAQIEAQIDAFDPDHQARAIVSIFSDDRPIAGRPVYGPRQAAWRALEDKAVIDAVWDACGVARAPSEVVDARRDALDEAAARLDEGHGTVWAADASQGFHGGGSYTLPVFGPADAERAATRLAQRAAQARVMPFLPGVPCSIHGIVMPGRVMVFRPVEMLTLLGPQGFVYARAATTWDPPELGREHMRQVARRAGAYLRDTVDYRGAFTVDGVMGADGFRPTELNPRVGAALGLLQPAIPFGMLNLALIERHPVQVDPQALEEAVVAHADANRRVSIALQAGIESSETQAIPLAWRGGAWVESTAEDSSAVAHVGPGVSGTYAALRVGEDVVPPGERAGPYAAAFAAWLDGRFAAGIGACRALG